MTTPDWTLLPGDCRLTMRLCLAPDNIDSVVTDPPYDLTSIVKRFGKAGSAPAQFGTDGAFSRASRGFMNQQWDGTGVAFDPATWAEVYRILKPGGHLLAFGGTRTYHRMVCAIEDAGFEIRDQIAWIYGSGFPKSHDVSKSIDRMAGAKREVVGFVRGGIQPKGGLCRGGLPEIEKMHPVTAPTTLEAQQWEGWGTALKPALEPIVLARKPLMGSVAANVLQHGTGALNIDGCRVSGNIDEMRNRSGTAEAGNQILGKGIRNPDGGIWTPAELGRFPANLIHDGSDEVLAVFPGEAAPASPVRGDEPSDVTNGIYGQFAGRLPGAFYGDKGNAARFFYCAKAKGSDREEGCEHLAFQVADNYHKIPRSQLDEDRRAGTVPRRNHHPTVKPEDLMRYLCRLITPPGGMVLDPFAGSGSTGKAALLEGFSFIGCEMTEEYLPIAEARLAHALNQWERDH